MSDRPTDPGQAAKSGHHAGVAFWAAVTACAPIVIILALIALKVI